MKKTSKFFKEDAKNFFESGIMKVEIWNKLNINYFIFIYT